MAMNPLPVVAWPARGANIDTTTVGRFPKLWGIEGGWNKQLLMRAEVNSFGPVFGLTVLLGVAALSA